MNRTESMSVSRWATGPHLDDLYQPLCIQKATLGTTRAASDKRLTISLYSRISFTRRPRAQNNATLSRRLDLPSREHIKDEQ
ncbi:hypothetical protein PsYK624_145990 [Phanerochaete sordida]|uniref:Uncharacterized protein n=1 Tax=Phanerochaete sordida TaxID=48140 RepID=A0A9P3GRX5_9APHY|nr:hypothetical protein PsYK624_145990 [Phanerochaete sordida]